MLALPGTLQYRLRADETGFRNLVFAGDWTRNGLEVGCAEGAVMSGLQAARALCDHPAEIVGEHELEFGMFASALRPRREWEREETQVNEVIGPRSLLTLFDHVSQLAARS